LCLIGHRQGLRGLDNHQARAQYLRIVAFSLSYIRIKLSIVSGIQDLTFDLPFGKQSVD
jgi:hypothetical protein